MGELQSKHLSRVSLYFSFLSFSINIHLVSDCILIYFDHVLHMHITMHRDEMSDSILSL